MRYKETRRRLADLEARLKEIDTTARRVPLSDSTPRLTARVAWTQPFDGEASGRLELCVNGIPFMVSPSVTASELRQDVGEDRYGYPGGQEAHFIAKLAPMLRASGKGGAA